MLSGPSLVFVALRATTVVWWANFALTSRWAHVPGSIHGPKAWWFVSALVALTIAVWWPRSKSPWLRPQDGPLITPRAAGTLAAVAAGLLACAFLVWFPLSTWTQIPFLDDWVPRFQSTRDFIAWSDASVG